MSTCSMPRTALRIRVLTAPCFSPSPSVIFEMDQVGHDALVHTTAFQNDVLSQQRRKYVLKAAEATAHVLAAAPGGPRTIVNTRHRPCARELVSCRTGGQLLARVAWYAKACKHLPRQLLLVDRVVDKAHVNQGRGSFSSQFLKRANNEHLVDC